MKNYKILLTVITAITFIGCSQKEEALKVKEPLDIKKIEVKKKSEIKKNIETKKNIEIKKAPIKIKRNPVKSISQLHRTSIIQEPQIMERASTLYIEPANSSIKMMDEEQPIRYEEEKAPTLKALYQQIIKEESKAIVSEEREQPLPEHIRNSHIKSVSH